MELFAFDDDYVRRLRDGDRWTEEHFRSYFEQLLFLKLRGRVRTADEIDDYRQEVFLRVLKTLRRDGLADGRKLGGFVNAVCNNLILERGRTAKRTEPLAEDYEEAATDENAEQVLVAEETKRLVLRVLDQLEDQRDATILRALFLEDRDKDELCAELGITRDYLRVVLHRAKERFRAAYLGRVKSFARGLETKSGLLSLLL
jgi:RNA polymerase sigma-70 factor (ECF subfamily)